MTPDQEYVLKTVKARDVHFVRFWFTDVMGNMKSFAVNPNELEHAFEEGMGFDGSCINGFSDTAESDMLAFPDASTFQILPWRPDSNAVARMFCNIRTPEGEPFEGDSRLILSRVVQSVREAGYEANMGPEVEYFYFRDSKGTEVLDRGGYFDLTELDSGSDLRRDTVLALENMGIPVEYSHHESGPSQHEIDLRYSDACSMADAVMTYKMVVKEIAALHGVYASFMPKPLSDCPGSGMHVHLSLFDHDDRNAFFDPSDPLGHHLSSTAKHFIAGLLHYAPEFCLVTNQYVNSYKRLTGGKEAPAYVSWARSNRSTLVRIPGYRPSEEMACRVEMRNADPACNPYLAFAVMLAAGMAGIREQLPLPESSEGVNLSSLDPSKLRELGVQKLPLTLGNAIELFTESDLMKSVLGEHIHGYLVDAKSREWREYLKQVSPWELDRWLEVL
ncbi:MAG: type I glutamate--ammonia ligase [Eggerthellaceae bacterium]|nr:type I glutamate--ammonia ligase [Eggerthellaceae bacterium]